MLAIGGCVGTIELPHRTAEWPVLVLSAVETQHDVRFRFALRSALSRLSEGGTALDCVLLVTVGVLGRFVMVTMTA